MTATWVLLSLALLVALLVHGRLSPALLFCGWAGGYHLLGLISYFTTDSRMLRAWTIRRGWKAPAAAGVIHSDFEKGFIRAEVVAWSDLVEAGSFAAARLAGKMRLEGRDYVMRDGDVIEVRFNV